jgi:zinc protease
MTRILIVVAAWIALVLPAWAEVKIQQVTSPSGLTAWLVEEHSIPFIAIEIGFRGGTSLDAPGKRGATYLMTALIEEGAGDLDSRGFARAQESLAASFGYNASDDRLSISARFLTENRAEAVALLRSALHEPRFDEDALERVRGQVISGLMSDAKDPGDLVAEAFDKATYGDHPYATSGKGTIESVSALTRDDMLAAHAAVFARDRVYVGAVGDITPDELGLLIDQLLADFPETGAPLPGPVVPDIKGGVTVIDFATPQSSVLFAQRGMDQDDPDFFAAYVMNQALGGGSFESRLMTEVREKRGLTYGVYSYLLPKDNAAVYVGQVASGNDRVAEAIKVIRDTWVSSATEGFSQDEVEAAKTYLTGAYPLRFDGNARIASILTGMQMDGRPIDYINTRNDKVNAVTTDDVNRVARELLDPDALHFFVVGQPKGLETTTN